MPTVTITYQFPEERELFYTADEAPELKRAITEFYEALNKTIERFETHDPELARALEVQKHKLLGKLSGLRCLEI